MNPKILRHVNFLLDNNPSPFCDYIICKELLKLDEKTINDSYEWAKQFKLYTEILDEQLPDGSFGGFDTRNTVQSKGRHYKTTAQAILRMLDLSFDINDPMVEKLVEICKKYLSGETSLPDTFGKNNDCAPILIRRSIMRWLSHFDPDDNYVCEFRGETAERLTKSCEKGYFDYDHWSQLDINKDISHYSYESVYMLSYGDCISEDVQRLWLNYEWYKPLWYNPAKASDIMSPDQSDFHFWLIRLENLKHFSLFHEFMAEKTAPHLLALCDRLSDIYDDIPVFINNYNYHYGQYSEPPRNTQQKKNDLLLRIIRLLDRCE
ncbi:MAG: hypothetical protein K0S41_2365 [Anaerocolumna sp.]|jgi:hypothetical protein|nr:hypothetical protein [Anaerocolumna sp.]